MRYTIKKSNLLILAAITFAIIFVFMRGQATLIFSQIRHADWRWFALSLVCIFIYWCIEARTLYMMLNTYDTKFSYLQILKLVISTQFFNGITPFSTGGQPFQIYVLNKESHIGVSRITCASLHNFILYQSVLVFMGVAALFVKRFTSILPYDSPHINHLAAIGFTLNLLIILGILLIAVSPGITSRIQEFLLKCMALTPLKKRLPYYREHWTKNISVFHDNIMSLFNDKYLFFQGFLLNVVKLIAFYTVAYFICLSVGFSHITIWQALTASAYVMLITSIVPLPGGAGGAEIGFLLFFGSFIIGAQATAIMLLWRFVTYYFGLIVGMLTFYIGYSKPSSI